jgi:hypothetical protein
MLTAAAATFTTTNNNNNKQQQQNGLEAAQGLQKWSNAGKNGRPVGSQKGCAAIGQAIR